MSSAINHRKRSRYAEQKKAGAYRAQRRQAFYRETYDRRNRGILGVLGKMFHRRAPRKAGETDDGEG